MAALTMSPTIRQPFASLDSPRLETLMRSKANLLNQQNGLATPYKAQPTPEIDAENVDPTSLKLSSKRKRSDEDESITKPTKTTRTALSTSIETNFTTPTPRHFSLNVIPSTPKSAPTNPPTRKPAGRSPQAKSSKSSRRSSIAKRRFEPSNGKGVRRPFSLATALSNGKSKPQPKPKQSTTTGTTKPPASWFFDIHEDSEQDEMTNLMQHSTCVLDISDDEGKASSDGRGKENIPPVELGISIPNSTTTSRRNTPRKAPAVKMDEDRVPLVELNAADYYGDGCHAFSYAVVFDDEYEDENTLKESEKNSQTPSSLHVPRSSSHSHVRRGSSLQNVESISSILEATAPVKSDPAEKQTEEARVDSNLDFQIWESGSASGEAVENTEPSAESGSGSPEN